MAALRPAGCAMNATSHALESSGRTRPFHHRSGHRSPRGRALGDRPGRPGDDLPARGRSLFDFLVTQERGGERGARRPVSLRGAAKRVEAAAGRDSRTKAAKAVLIPLGRSLQRIPLRPIFRLSARAVVAVDTESARSGDLVSGTGFISATRKRRTCSKSSATTRTRGASSFRSSPTIVRAAPPGHVRQQDAVRRLPPECGADIFPRRLG
jgi:hypothetical protein